MSARHEQDRPTAGATPLGGQTAGSHATGGRTSGHTAGGSGSAGASGQDATALRPDDRRADPSDSDSPERTPASGPLLYVPFLVLLLAGFWLMGWAFDNASPTLWWVGLGMSSLSFLLPLQALRD